MQNLEKYLTQFSGKTIVYCPNPGNAGDAIIANATYQIFEKLNIRCEYVTTSVAPQRTINRVVIYGGGGNLVHPYPNARDFISLHHKKASKLVILPHTIRSYAEIFQEMSENVDIFCRDRLSYDFLVSVKSKANVYLSHDMALYTNMEKTFECQDGQSLEHLGNVLHHRQAKRKIRMMFHTVRNCRHLGTLNSFREDLEKTDIAIPFSNFDVSQMLCGQDMSPIHSRETAFAVFQFIQRHNIVRTNRLHVCIAALLLGKEVHFYDNSYGKNVSIYNHSLKDRFANLIFHAD